MAPSKTICPLAIVIAFAASTTPDINVVEAKDVNPAKVPTVAPRPTAVLPIVTDELANEELGILALVPNAPVELSYMLIHFQNYYHLLSL